MTPEAFIWPQQHTYAHTLAHGNTNEHPSQLHIKIEAFLGRALFMTRTEVEANPRPYMWHFKVAVTPSFIYFTQRKGLLFSLEVIWGP